MPPNPRRQKIEAMLQTDPDDTFLRYGLAMEMISDGELESSVEQLAPLLLESPPYVPAFFLSGQQLVKLGRIEQARAMLRDGIVQAKAQHQPHPAREMSEFLESLG